MAKRFFLGRKGFWLTLLKCLALAFVALMILIQIPELTYDLSPKQPLSISSPRELDPERFKGTTFVSIAGTPNFERAFIYQRYGLAYTYFELEPYGLRLVVRTYEKVSEDWTGLRRILGKLRPFDQQPFSYRIREIYLDQFQEEIPEGAFFLGMDDVPRLSGWQLGATIFSSLLWLAMFYMFFFFRRSKGKRVPPQPTSSQPAPSQPAPS